MRAVEYGLNTKDFHDDFIDFCHCDFHILDFVRLQLLLLKYSLILLILGLILCFQYIHSMLLFQGKGGLLFFLALVPRHILFSCVLIPGHDLLASSYILLSCVLILGHELLAESF